MSSPKFNALIVVLNESMNSGVDTVTKSKKDGVKKN
jgi:hypothetical protein